MELNNKNGKNKITIGNRTSSFIVYIIFCIILLAIFLLKSLENGEINSLSFVSLLFMWLLILPIFLSSLTWYHPLILLLPFYFIQALAMFLMGLNILPMQIRFLPIFNRNEIELIYIKSIFINFVGFTAMYISNYTTVIKKKVYKPLNIHIKFNTIKLAVLVLIISWGAYLFTILSTTGSLIHALTQVNENYTRGLYRDLNFLKFISSLGIIASLLFLFRGNKKTAIAVAIFQMVILYSFAERGGMLLFTVMPFLIIWHLYIKQIPLKRLSIYGFVVISIYTLMANLRYTGQIFGSGFMSLYDSFIRTVGGVAHHQITATIIYYIDNNLIQYLYGAPLINIFIAWIPRSFWSGKPIISESGIVGRIILGPDGYGLPPGIFGYGYVNFGWVGVLLFGLLSGVTVSYFYNKLVGFYINNTIAIPKGNAIIYVFLVTLVPPIMHTEAQMKILMYLAVLCVILFLANKKFVLK